MASLALRSIAVESHDASTPGQPKTRVVYGNDQGSRDEAPLVGWLDDVFVDAIRRKASDIHFEPFEQELSVRLRIDGVLLTLPSPPFQWTTGIASRIKVLASLDISERRLPQDGRIGLTFEGRAVDLRVSTLSTVHGESIVVRVLDRASVKLELDGLGMPPDVLGNFRELISRPSGLVIVTGPTGSGKTTTLYSALSALNQTELKVLTAEDPVEYDIQGVIQTSVNPAIGLSFAAALRTFLRQDPDVIMVGEIRDLETAQMAIQAALTGHLVLSTLHTQDAAGAVGRLIDMGVEPFLVSAAIVGVLAQRLVRRVCPQCQNVYQPERDVAWCAAQSYSGTTPSTFSRGEGCDACGGSGYQGRRGLYEFLSVDTEMRELIANQAPGIDLKRAAVAKGMRTLRSEGIEQVYQGLTSIDDVLAQT